MAGMIDSLDRNLKITLIIMLEDLNEGRNCARTDGPTTVRKRV
jgi:hypothetical protein